MIHLKDIPDGVVYQYRSTRTSFLAFRNGFQISTLNADRLIFILDNPNARVSPLEIEECDDELNIQWILDCIVAKRIVDKPTKIKDVHDEYPLTTTELQPGMVYYYPEWHNGDCYAEMIVGINGDKSKSTAVLIGNNTFNNKNYTPRPNIRWREANNFEKNWLQECVNQDKFISRADFEQMLKLRIEGVKGNSKESIMPSLQLAEWPKEGFVKTRNKKIFDFLMKQYPQSQNLYKDETIGYGWSVSGFWGIMLSSSKPEYSEVDIINYIDSKQCFLPEYGYCLTNGEPVAREKIIKYLSTTRNYSSDFSINEPRIFWDKHSIWSKNGDTDKHIFIPFSKMMRIVNYAGNSSEKLIFAGAGILNKIDYANPSVAGSLSSTHLVEVDTGMMEQIKMENIYPYKISHPEEYEWDIIIPKSIEKFIYKSKRIMFEPIKKVKTVQF